MARGAALQTRVDKIEQAMKTKAWRDQMLTAACWRVLRTKHPSASRPYMANANTLFMYKYVLLVASLCLIYVQ